MDEDFGFETPSGGTKEVMVLRSIRFGSHPGFERVVIEFVPQRANPEEGIPRYRTRTGPLPYRDGQGKEVSLRGSHFFEIVYNGNVADLSQDAPKVVYKGPERFVPGFSIIEEARFVPAYENNTLVLTIGLSQETPFRVQEFFDRARIVIDFQTP